MEGWILIQHETDEFYGMVQWRYESGEMTDKKEIVERWPPDMHYVFSKSGMGKLKIVPR